MGRSSRSRSSSISSRQSSLRRTGGNSMSQPNNSNTQSYSSGNGMMQPKQSSGKSGFLSNIMGTVASGMASGVGFGVAQRAVDSVLGPRHVEVSHANNDIQNNSNNQMNQAAAVNSSVSRCQPFMDELNQCLMRHSDVSLCQNYADSLKSCQQSM